MSSRGRGYAGKGNYNSRGSGYRGSYRGGRGSYESRGGRGGGGNYSSYENRYNSGGRYPSNRDRGEESFKKPYRMENSYSGREYGRSGSPDRKRMRMEDYVQGPSDRRSHDGGGHYYGSRQENYSSERRGYGGEERRRSPSRELREYRKSDMGVRSPARSRVARAPRRSLRGRTLRSRGSLRGTRGSRGFAARRFGDRAAYPRSFLATKGHSSVKNKEEEASSTEEEWDADEKEEIEEEKKEVKTKSPKPEPASVDGEAAGADDGEETDKEGGDAASEEAVPPARPANARPYVRLFCVHCKEKYSTFGGYARHLVSSKHSATMSAVARRHKAQLVRMRSAQRAAQRSLETAEGAQLAPHSTFCLICRLNHRATRHAHNLSDTHRAMKRFLMPFCRVCSLPFTTPMIYEHHVCSIDHLKQKANQAAQRASPKEEASGEEGMEVDMDNFMTLDSVGDVDEVDDEDSGTEKKDEAEPKKPKVQINIGQEHIKKVEVYWCELCRVYLSRGVTAANSPDAAETLRRHCRLRKHLRSYVQHRDTRTLRKHAERIHRQLHNKDGDKANNADESATEATAEKQDETAEENKHTENGTEEASGGNEDKMWADVDKDIGDLLREVDPQVNVGSDDEDDLDRYDKFRKSDKSNDAEENIDNAAETETEIKNGEINSTA